MDPTGWLSYAAQSPWIVAVVAAGVLFLAFRRVFRSLRAEISARTTGMMQDVEQKLYQWAFDERKIMVEGKEMVERKPSARLVGLAQVVAPVFIATGIEWAKQNVKINPGQFIQGGAAGGIGDLLAGGLPPNALKMIPKEWRGIATIAAPFLSKFIGPKAGATTAAQTSSGMVPYNP